MSNVEFSVNVPTSADQRVKGPIPRSAKIFSIYLNEELTQKVNNMKKKNSATRKVLKRKVLMQKVLKVQ